jgi:3-methyladenine DNA glycosylase AlkC
MFRLFRSLPQQSNYNRAGIITDFALWYAKSKQMMKYRPLVMLQQRRSLAPTISWYVENENEVRPLARHEVANPESLPRGSKLLWLADLLSRAGGIFAICCGIWWP